MAAVNDGWSGRPAPLRHQLLLIPFTLAFAVVLWRLLFRGAEPAERKVAFRFAIGTVLLFEAASVLAVLYEARHFARFGYSLQKPLLAVFLLLLLAGFGFAVVRRSAAAVLGADLTAYGAGLVLAIRAFPLNYLRSDMLPVILWADRRLAQHLNPYVTMHVGGRLYDFPYLPGMMVVYLPVVAAGLDPRWMNLACVVVLGGLLVWASRAEERVAAALLVGAFVLSPFLQYRHEIYLEPHWLTLVVAFVLMQRGRFGWAAAAFGLSMAIYQLSWVLFPFFVLQAFWRGGWRETLKLVFLAVACALGVAGPFLRLAARQIASNTVGQWSRLPHALADPMNFSYWLTYLVRPGQLRWVQAVAMLAIFVTCATRRRCRTLEDTLRWMSGALALFIALNVLVDGYFYLTLLLVVLVYTLVVSGIWTASDQAMPMLNAGTAGP